MVQLPERISRLEGACERVADRLNGIDAKLTILDQKMDVRFDAVDRKFSAVYGFLIGRTAVILGVVAAAAFALHQ